MVDKSKMSVADILAAARKTDGAGKAPTAEAPAMSPATDAPSASPSPAKKPVAGGSRPSVAEMLAMARGEKQGGATASVPVVKEKPTRKAAAKPVAPAAKQEMVPVSTGPIDTQSILAAARKGAKPGPMTKAEAAARGAFAVPETRKARAKEAIVVPPMPVRPESAKPLTGRAKDQPQAERRAFLFGFSALTVGFAGLAATFGAWTLATVRFMFPSILREPPSRFKVGFPDQYPAGQVEEKFKAQFGVWIVNTEYHGEQQLVALRTVCTHLGCTPNWLETEQKFKCPCHGSGFYKDGINFEGPAPRPLERYAISIASDGQIEVDKSRMFQEEMGQWNDPGCYIPV
jgi:cytochrome b6-f complex iron-sulfur subunit